MSANQFNNFTEYGVGIGLRVPHYHNILTRKPIVDWFETGDAQNADTTG